MNVYKNLYCKMFIDTSCDINDLTEMLLGITKGQTKNIRTIITQFGEIDINLNDEYKFHKKNPTNDFVFFKFFLDIFPNNSVGQNNYIESIAELNSKLKQQFSVVAACDFENELHL